MRHSSAMLTGGLILALGSGLVGCAGKSLAGKAAPNFTLKDLSGETVSLAQFQGKPVLLSFFGMG